MIKILIATVIMGGSLQAGSFSQADYAAMTGKLPAKVEKKETPSYAQKAESVQSAIIKLEAKRVNLRLRVSEVGKQYSEQIAKIGRLDGDTTASRQAATRIRATRLFTINQEMTKVGEKLAILSEVLAHYKAGAEFQKRDSILKAKGYIS